MSSKFYQFIDRVLVAEGEFTNDKDDPGNWTGGRVGAGVLKGTKFGISAARYPSTDIEHLTRDMAIALYKRDFWEQCHADDLPDAVAFSALDGAVNSGPVRSMQWLQQAAGVADDGKWGPFTQIAIKRADPNDLLILYNAARLEFMTRLVAWDTQGKGWARRIAKNLRYGAEDN